MQRIKKRTLLICNNILLISLGRIFILPNIFYQQETKKAWLIKKGMKMKGAWRIKKRRPCRASVQAQDWAIVAVSLNSPTRTDALYGRLWQTIQAALFREQIIKR